MPTTRIRLQQVQHGEDLIRKTGEVAFTADQSMGNNRLVNLAPGVNNTDAVTLEQLNDKISEAIGSTNAVHDYKESVKVATTGPITLSGTQTIDGVNVVVGDRVLVKDQVDAKQNGIYVVAEGAWSRASDYDGSPNGEISAGNVIAVESGTVSGGKLYMQINVVTQPYNEANQELEFMRIKDLSDLIAGNGLEKSGNILNAKVDNVTVEIDGNNAFQVKNSGITTNKIADNAVDKTKINEDVAGDGLGQAADGSLQVNTGNGLTISNDAVAIQVASGAPLTASANGLNVNVDNITINVDSNNLAVKNGGISTSKLATGAVTAEKVDASVAGEGLSKNGTTGALDVNAGDGIAVEADAVTVKIANGAPLSKSAAGLTVEVDGSTISIVNGKLSAANASTLDGEGIIANNGKLDVNTDNVTLEISNDKVQIKDGGVSTNKLATGAVTAEKVDASVAGEGLVKNSTTGALDVNVSSTGGLQVENDEVSVKLNNNGTITSDANGLKVNVAATGGIQIVSNSLSSKLKAGGGISSDADGLYVDSSIVRTTQIVRHDATTGDIDGTNTQFTLSSVPLGGTLVVYLNGLRLREGATFDYTYSNGVITFNVPPVPGDWIEADYFSA